MKEVVYRDLDPKKLTIFLDFDGVLNHQEHYEKLHNHDAPYKFDHKDIDPNIVYALNLLVNDIQIIISSSWRISKDFDDKESMEPFVKYCGFDPKIIYGKTASIRIEGESVDRGVEIDHFVKKYNIENYFIIDDDSDMLMKQFDHFIKTDALKDGLNVDIIEYIIKTLGYLDISEGLYYYDKNKYNDYLNEYKLDKNKLLFNPRNSIEQFGYNSFEFNGKYYVKFYEKHPNYFMDIYRFEWFEKECIRICDHFFK